MLVEDDRVRGRLVKHVLVLDNPGELYLQARVVDNRVGLEIRGVPHHLAFKIKPAVFQFRPGVLYRVVTAEQH